MALIAFNSSGIHVDISCQLEDRQAVLASVPLRRYECNWGGCPERFDSHDALIQHLDNVHFTDEALDAECGYSRGRLQEWERARLAKQRKCTFN